MQIYSPIAQDSLVVSGSMNVSGSVTAQSFTGSFSGTASYAATALTASYALTASVALNVPATASYAIVALTASYANFAVNTTSASFAVSAALASQASNASSASFATNASTAASASFATNASNAASASYALSASYTTASAFSFNATSASYALTASYATASSVAVSASFATNAANASSASYALNSSNTISASFARSASYAMSASYATASSFATTASYALFAATATTSSFATNASTAASASFATNAGTAGSASYAVSASYATASGFAASASYALNASNAVTASHALNSVSASYALFAANSTSASYALSASYAFNSSVAVSASFSTNAGFAGSASYAQQANTASSADNFTVRGTLTATNIVVQTITSSQSTITGSTRFGSIITNTHQFTGSVLVTGSINVIDGVTNNLTASWAVRAISSSFASNASTAASASFATNASTAASASFATSAANATTASHAVNAVTASHAINAVTASFALNSQNAFVQGGNSFGTTALLGTNDAQSLQFETNGAVVMTISSSFVGINNSSPTHMLDITTNRAGNGAGSTIRLNRPDSSSFENAINWTTNGSSRWFLGSDNDSTENFYLYNWVRGAFEISVLSSTGNVGIGTTNPAARLDLTTSGTAQQLRLRNTNGTTWDFFSFNDSNLYINNASATIFTITNSGNVGINDSSPTERLEISGSIFINSENSGLIVDAGGSRRVGFMKYPGREGGLWRTGSDGIAQDFEIGRVLSGSLINPVTVTTDFYVAGDGNIGIGTITPADKLDVAGNIRVSSTNFFRYDGDTGLVGSGTSISGGAATQLGIRAANDILFATNGTSERMRIASGGNVGIGTTAPSQLVEANQSFNGDVVYQITNPNAGTSATAQFFASNGTTRTQFFHTGTAYNAGGSGILTNAFNLGGIFNNQRGIALLAANAAGSIMFGTGPSNTEVMRITGSNVGIGVSTPTNLLHTAGASATPSLRLGSVSAGFHWDIGRENQTTGDFVFNNANGGATSERVRITVGGNVGIGTASPGYELQVYNSGDFTTAAFGGTEYGVRIDNGGTFSSGRSTIYGVNSTFYGSYQPLAIGGSLLYFNISGTDRMIIDANGNLGIGTTAPGARLTVYAGSGTISGTNDAIRLQVASYNNAARNTIVWHQDGGNTILARYGLEWNSSPGNMNFVWRDVYANNATGSTELMRLQGNGSLGIGTTSPAARLHVSGADAILRNAYIGEVPTYGSANAQFSHISRAGTDEYSFLSANDGTTFINAKTGFEIRFRINNTDRIVMNSGGNLGIGTTAPSSKLHVLGSKNQIIADGGTNAGAEIAFYTSLSTSPTLRRNWSIATEDQIEGDFVIKSSNTAGGSPITTRLAILSNGNVGIGTSNPTSAGGIALVIYDSTTARTYWKNSSTNTHGGGIAQFNDDFYIFNTETGGNVYFQDSVSTRLTLASGGNVGIGTTNPTSTLQVIGSLAVGAGTAYTNIRFENSASIGGYNGTHVIYPLSVPGSGTAQHLTYFKTNGSPGAQTVHNVIIDGAVGIGGNVGIGTTSPAYRLDVRSGAIFVAGGGFSGPESETGYRVKMHDNGGVHNDPGIGLDGAGGAGEIMWFNAFNGFYFNYGTQGVRVRFDSNGNVGIGTTAPANKLQIGSVGTTGFGANDIAIGNGTQVMTFFQSSTISNWYTNTSFALLPAGAGAVGNVGIGSSAPAYRLDVSGTGRFTGVLTVETDILTRTKLQISNGRLFEIIGSSTALNIYDGSAGSSRMLIDSSGNVGIGTTTPAQKLDVRGNSLFYNTGVDTFLTIQGNSSFDAVLEFKSDQGGITSEGFQMWYTNNVGDMRFATTFPNDAAAIRFHTRTGASKSTSNERLTIAGSGNVGINSTSPAYRLDVNGTSYFNGSMGINGEGNGLTVDTGYGNNGRVGLMKYGGLEGMLVAGNTTTLRLGHRTDSDNVATSGTPTIRVDLFIATNGSVGIGSNSPAYALDVTGTIRATGDVIAYSDARVKENVNTITDALTKVTSLRGVTYTRKDSEDKSTKVGVIAQEVLPILPEVVQQDDNGNYSVAYGNIVGVLIEAIKELKAEIDELKNNKQ